MFYDRKCKGLQLLIKWVPKWVPRNLAWVLNGCTALAALRWTATAGLPSSQFVLLHNYATLSDICVTSTPAAHTQLLSPEPTLP